ncbi:hypothetical protein M569_03573, partial [Genlisea aurea]
TFQDHTSAASGAVPADWASFQAYSPMPPHGFLASSPQAHPYIWGVQQFIPPYGTSPHPYVTMYPHGGLYAHPTMAPGTYPFSPYGMPSPNGVAEPSSNAAGPETGGKSPEGKGKLPIKRSKGSLGSLNMITGKVNEPERHLSGAAANGSHPKSCETASGGSSEGSDANSQHESQVKSGDQSSDQGEELPQNGVAAQSSQNGRSIPPHGMMTSTLPIVPVPAVGAVSGIPGPATNLNIGIDYWGTTPTPSSSIPGSGSRDSIQPQMYIQDERELKRQKRKLSNRESARRSRLRKQADFDELAQRAEALKEENASLRAELSRLKAEYEQLVAQNASLK